MSIANKIYQSTAALSEQIADWRSDGEVIVFTNGVYDLIHIGHVTYLEQAKSLGTKLIVGVNSDVSVQRIKGDSRPINDEQSRMAVIAALQSTDAIYCFEDDTPLELIKTVGPDILVKGSDYAIEDVVGATEVRAAGGKVQLIDFVEGYSSTSIIQKILANE